MDLIVYSHLRWDFVYQRPQHVLSRFGARGWNVLFVEEPIAGDRRLHLEEVATGVTVVRPELPAGLDAAAREREVRQLLERELRLRRVHRPVLWFYTPMAVPLADTSTARAVVYDCMDELSAFAGADPLMREREAKLLARADLVFTGGRSLYEAKRARHDATYCFPSSVDVAHYSRAREWKDERPDQAAIPRPRLGYFGVIDERFDVGLLDGMAAQAPGWSFVVIGPVVKIDPRALPSRPNIHYLGPKKYDELPGYIATWDVALIPFARNAATRYISPTKVLEYMAAGKPVVSTSIPDIVTPYGEQRLVRIADSPLLSIAAARDGMSEDARARVEAFDRYLAGTSWDRTASQMESLVRAVADGHAPALREREAAAA